MAIENLRKHLILALSVFQFAFWLYICSHQKKQKPFWKMSWTHPPARLLAMVRTPDMVLGGGNNFFLVPRDRLAKLRSARRRLLPTPIFSSPDTHFQDGRKSGGVVQWVLYIDIQELLLLILLHLQAAASILLLSFLPLLAGRSSWCCCLTLGFHCLVSCYCSCSIVWSLVPVNSSKRRSIICHSFILGIDREQHV